MIKKFNFENSANKDLLAEILSKRDRQPRAAFLSSLAAIMVTAISLTMVFGSLSTSAIPLDNHEQANVTSVSDGETLPPEEVTRVHTETKTETVSVYNDTPQLSETLLVSDTVNEEPLAEGKAIFDPKKQLFQWQYKGETFTFFAKDNTVYRRNETTGSTVVVFKGYKKASLFCINDRYLFFSADSSVNSSFLYYSPSNSYCYRADLVTGEILRLFICTKTDYQYEEEEAFVRFNGDDVIFTHYVVHEDGNYERIEDSSKGLYDDNDDPELILNVDNTFTAIESDGSRYDLEINAKDIESMGYNAYENYGIWIDHFYTEYAFEQTGEYIHISFAPKQDDPNAHLWYWGQITDEGIKGCLVQAKILNQPENTFPMYLTSLCFLVYYDQPNYEIFGDTEINFDKLFADTKSETEYRTIYDGYGEKLTLAITYYPINYLHAATPDSAE